MRVGDFIEIAFALLFSVFMICASIVMLAVGAWGIYGLIKLMMIW